MVGGSVVRRGSTQGVGCASCSPPSIRSREAQVTTMKQQRGNALIYTCSFPADVPTQNIFFVQDGFSSLSCIIIMMITLLAVLVATISCTQEGVVLLNSRNLQEAIEANNRLVVFFSQEDCLYCTQFSEAFALVAALHAPHTIFGKLSFSPDSASLFHQYSIDSTPTVAAFSEGSSLPHRFEPSGSGSAISVELFKWVSRVFQPLREWESEQGHSHQLIIDCDGELAPFWQEVGRTELWLDLHCGNHNQLGRSLAIVYEYGRRVEAWEMQSQNAEKVAGKLSHLIKAYKYKYVVTWGTTIAQEVFRHKVNAFVLLVNNQSLSQQLQREFQEVKKEWYESAHSFDPTIFAVADLSLHPFETIKLKRFLTGYHAFTIRQYIYPILAFIKPPHKYIFNLTAPKNGSILQDFIASAHAHLIRNEPYDDSEPQFIQWLNEGEEHVSKIKKDEDDQEDAERERAKPILSQQNWQDLLGSYERPFFVYFTWRTNHKLTQLDWLFRQWWEGSDAAFAPHRKAYDVFLHLHHTTDLPAFPNLTVNYFPSLFYFNKEKQIVKLQGVTDLQKIKQFINQTYLSDAQAA